MGESGLAGAGDGHKVLRELSSAQHLTLNILLLLLTIRQMPHQYSRIFCIIQKVVEPETRLAMCMYDWLRTCKTNYEQYKPSIETKDPSLPFPPEWTSQLGKHSR